jgi:integrase
LTDELVALLKRHREDQAAERELAAELWCEGGWVFASPVGEPVNPATNNDEWKRLLVAAGLRDGRLHDARHTAATVLLIIGVPERAVMEIMGWASSSMAKRYQHMTAKIRRDIARQVGGVIWQTEPGEDDDGAAGGALVRT